MGFLGFEKREKDWWLFTLFPVLLLFVVLLFSFLTERLDYRNVILIFSQQLLFFSIVLCVTNIGILAKGQFRDIQIGFPLYILVICVVGLMFGYSVEMNLMQKFKLLLTFFVFSTFLNYFSILFLNKNPLSSPLGEVGAKEITQSKEEFEKKAKIELTSPSETTEYGGVRFGEHDE